MVMLMCKKGSVLLNEGQTYRTSSLFSKTYSYVRNFEDAYYVNIYGRYFLASRFAEIKIKEPELIW
jgi:hypothetical protein